MYGTAVIITCFSFKNRICYRRSRCVEKTHNTKKEDPMAWTQAEIETCIENCKKKAAVDADFRKKLLVDPVAAVKEISGKEVPAGFKIKVLENDQ